MTYDKALKELEEARESHDYYYEGWVGIDVAETFLEEIEQLREQVKFQYAEAERLRAALVKERSGGGHE